MNPLFDKHSVFPKQYSQNLNPEQDRRNVQKFTSNFSHLDILNANPKKKNNATSYSLLEQKLGGEAQFSKNRGIRNQSYDYFSKKEIFHNKLSLESNATSQLKSFSNNIQISKSHDKSQQYEISISRLQKQLEQSKRIQKRKQYQHQTEIKQLCKRIEQLQKLSFLSMQKNKSLQKQIQQMQITDNQKSNAINNNVISYPVNQKQKYRLLGKQFQVKINQLYDENYKLKNSLSLLQSRLQESQTKNRSLQIMIQAFQNRQSIQQAEKDLQKSQLKKQIKKLREQNSIQKQEKDRNCSQYELQILKIQSKLQQIHPNKNLYEGYDQIKHTENLQIQIQELQTSFKQQINQIIRLKQKNTRLSKLFSLKNY